MRHRVVKLWAVLLLLPVAIVLATGCWDHRELEDLAFVLVMGVDQAEAGAVTVTFIIAKPAQLGGAASGGGGGGGGAAGGEKPFVVISATAPTVRAAVDVANSYNARQMSLVQCNALVVGRPLAESGMSFMDGLARDREWRGTAGFFIAQGTAKEILDNIGPGLETNPGKLFTSIMSTYKTTGFIPRQNTYMAFTRTMSVSRDPVGILVAARRKGEVTQAKPGSLEGEYVAGQLPRPVGDNNLEFHGLAVINGWTMVGELNGVETTIYNMIAGDFGIGDFSIPDPSDPTKYVAVQLNKARPPKVDVKLSDPDHPQISIKLAVEGLLLSIRSGVDYTNPAQSKVLEQAISDLLTKQTYETLEKIRQMGADIVGFGLYARSNFATWDQWQSYQWRKHFAQAKFDVEVKTSMRRIGMQQSPIRPQ